MTKEQIERLIAARDKSTGDPHLDQMVKVVLGRKLAEELRQP